MIRTVSGPRVSLAGLIIATVISGLAMPILAAEPAVELPGISVAGEREAALVVTVDPQDTPQTRPNTAELLRRTPGGNVNTNGPLSGIAHYRGMYSYRVSTKVDGVPITPGGPKTKTMATAMPKTRRPLKPLRRSMASRSSLRSRRCRVLIVSFDQRAAGPSGSVREGKVRIS